MSDESAARRPAVRWDLVALGFVLSIATAVIFAEFLQATGDWNSGLGWERASMLAIPREIPVFIDLVFLTLPWLSSNTTVLPLVLIVALWLWRVRKRPDLALQIVIVDLGTFVLTPLLKVLYDRPRPDLWAHRGQYAWASYPSGHAIIGIAVYSTIAILAYRERSLRWPAVVLALLLVVSLYSRVYLGVHWPTDVIGGALAGAVWLGFTLAAFNSSVIRSIDEPEPAE